MMTVKIILTRGMDSIVDDEDGDLAEMNWCYAEGYAIRTDYSNGKKNLRLHVLVLERKLGRPIEAGKFPDHQNGDGLDNRRSNLREATRTQNAQNRRNHFQTSSKFKGVSYDQGKWDAKISVGGKLIGLGSYSDEIEAARVYNEAASRHFGEFAYLNPLPSE